MKINVKLEKDTLVMKLDEERSFADQKTEVQERLLSMKSFLSGGHVKFAYEGRELTFEEEIELSETADFAFEREVSFCHKKRPPHSILRHVMTKDERIAKKFLGTVAPGECIESAGDLIVVGDVSPAAQLKAVGDVYVIGNLRGVAHAGCEGDEGSLIYAMGMNPVMIKIADKIKFISGKRDENENGIARVKNNEILVELM